MVHVGYFSKKRITKALISLRKCAGWSASCCSKTLEDRFSRVQAQHCMYLSPSQQFCMSCRDGCFLVETVLSNGRNVLLSMTEDVRTDNPVIGSLTANRTHTCPTSISFSKMLPTFSTKLNWVVIYSPKVHKPSSESDALLNDERRWRLAGCVILL